MDDITKERERFETAMRARPNGFFTLERYNDPECTDYVHYATQYAWEAWQASRSSEGAPAGGVQPELDLHTAGDYAHLAPESWDIGYRDLWLRCQAAEQNKLVYRRAWLAALSVNPAAPLAEEGSQIAGSSGASSAPRDGGSAQ